MVLWGPDAWGCRRIIARIDNLPADSAFVTSLVAWMKKHAPKKKRRNATAEEMKSAFGGAESAVRYVPDSQEPE